jgi:hypothetical protein
MATDTPQPAGDHQTEHCSSCDQLTKHEVSVEIREESSDDSPTRKFSREPYRVTTCRVCGTETVQRMNNA